MSRKFKLTVVLAHFIKYTICFLLMFDLFLLHFMKNSMCDSHFNPYQDHRNTYITEDDFNFMSRNGINAVRIPVGWWIASDPSPPKPFVGGSLRALDNAFTWAQ